MSPPRAPPLRIGSRAPNFDAVSTQGRIKFYDFIEGKWALLSAHPMRNPVSTTELAYLDFLEPALTERHVKVIALAPGSLETHHEWLKEMSNLAGKKVNIPIIVDDDGAIATAFDMMDKNNPSIEGLPPTVRDLFIIDPKKKVRLIFSYPNNVGGNGGEILRVIDALQTPDDTMTPVNWVPGQPFLVHPDVSTKAIVKKDDVEEVKQLTAEVRLAIPVESQQDAGMLAGACPTYDRTS